MHLGRTGIVIAGDRVSKDARLSTGYGEAIQGNVWRPAALDRRVAIARRETGVFQRPVAPRDDESI